MKKIFRFMLAVAVMFGAASCAKENISSVTPVGQEVEVTFVADLGGIESRAIADGTTVDEVAWAIYEDGANAPLASLQGTLKLQGKQATLSTRLVTGKTYDLAFFAYKAVEAKEELGGTVDPVHYEVFWADKKVAMKLDPKPANDEERDCFWYVEHDLKIVGPTNKTFILTRPLAQLNLGVAAADIEAAKSAGFSVSDSQITVNTYTQFNLFDGSLSEKTPIEVTFDRADSPVDSANELTVKDDTTIYKYLATTYLLVNEKVTSNVEVTLWDQDGGLINTLEYSYVPFQRNYRTNILGNLLTNPALFTIVIDERFEDDYLVEHWDGTITPVVADAQGDYVVKNAAELAYIAQLVNGGNNLEGKVVTLADNIDMNGNTWEPIGGANGAFAGTFDGAGFTVSNFIVRAEEYAGLFGNVFKTGEAAVIKNVKVDNAVIEGSHYAGTIAGYIYGNITGCEVSNATVTLTPNLVKGAYDNGDKAGAVVGYVGEGPYLITNNKVNNVIVTAYRDLGGVVGMAQGGVTVSGNEGANVALVCDQKTNNYGAKDANAGAVVGRKTATTVIENNNVAASIEYLNATVVVNADTVLDKFMDISGTQEVEGVHLTGGKFVSEVGIATTTDTTIWLEGVEFDCTTAVDLDSNNTTVLLDGCKFSTSKKSDKLVVSNGGGHVVYLLSDCYINGNVATVADIEALCENVLVMKMY